VSDDVARLRRDLEQAKEEIAGLQSSLERERLRSDEWRRMAEERRVAAERLRQQPLVKLVLPVARAVLPVASRLADRGGEATRRTKRSLGRARTLRRRLGARHREQELLGAVRALPDVEHEDQRLVSVVILTRDGVDNLRRLLPALRATASDCFIEILVLDNGSDQQTRAWLAEQQDITVVRSETNLSYSAANNLAAQHASGEVFCFLNDDVEPVSHGWLLRMLKALQGEVVAVGAQLVYPRRGLTGHAVPISVQHLGIDLIPSAGGPPLALNRGAVGLPDPSLPPFEAAAVTGACLVVRTESFWAVGGFDPRYTYGSEDVDLCWALREGGGRIIVVPQAVLLHYEGATRHRADPAVLRERQSRNRDALAERFGPAMRRALDEDRLSGRLKLTAHRFHVAITVTRDDETAGYGDWYTAHELGQELEALGWRVSYVERYQDTWYDLPAGIDALLVLIDTYDLRRLPEGVLRIAWIRNWAERWTSHPWFEEYDAVLASSSGTIDMIVERSAQRPVIFPLATNAGRFTPGTGARDGVVFAGNNWGHGRRPRDFLGATDDLVVLGRGWETVPEVLPFWRGERRYKELPEVYRSAAAVLDHAADHTLQEGSLNSRVFDAIAAGAVPVTNQSAGRDLFGPDLPVYDSASSLRAVLAELADDPVGTAARVRRLRREVLTHHTYAVRARQLQSLLQDMCQRPRFALVTGVPAPEVAATWGDWHFAHDMGRALKAHDVKVTVHTLADADVRRARAADVLVHLRGRGEVPPGEGQLSVIWCISHPEDLSPEACDRADLVLVASHTDFVADLQSRTRTEVAALLQATDPKRFHPHPPLSKYEHPVAFVGNSRFVRRPVVEHALTAGLDLAVYGANWERFLPADAVRAVHIPNDELSQLYSSVSVLLNDHWEGMRVCGMASNRIFDALACGTVVVSDELPGVEELFDGGVLTYKGPSDLRRTVEALLMDEGERRRRAERGRAAVIAAHTFEHRAVQLLDLVTPRLSGRANAHR
jgi:GT2 family glycosyltransferase/spore maturation protein CgeB